MVEPGDFASLIAEMSPEHTKRILYNICNKFDDTYNRLNMAKNQDDYVDSMEWAYDILQKELRRKSGGRKTLKNKGNIKDKKMIGG